VEINRVLLRVMRMADLDEAICIIREARIKYGNYSGLSADALDDILGLPVHADQVPARIAPWFSFAGWGGLIIEQNVDSEGFRNLTSEAVPLVEKILENPPTYYATEDEDDWLTYYIGSAIETEENTEETVAVINVESGDTVAADVRVFEEIPDDLTIDQLGRILAEMYSKAAGNQQVVAIHMFGLKYGKVIIEKGYTAASITRASDMRCSPFDCDKVRLTRFHKHYAVVLSMSKMFLLNKVTNFASDNTESFCFLFPTEVLFEGFIGGFMQDVLREEARSDSRPAKCR